MRYEEKKSIQYDEYDERGRLFRINQGFSIPFELYVEFVFPYEEKEKIIQIADTKFYLICSEGREIIKDFFTTGGDWVDSFMDIFIALGPESFFQVRKDSIQIVNLPNIDGTLKTDAKRVERAVEILTVMSRELRKLEEKILDKNSEIE